MSSISTSSANATSDGDKSNNALSAFERALESAKARDTGGREFASIGGNVGNPDTRGRPVLVGGGERGKTGGDERGSIGGNAGKLLEAIEASGREDEAPEGASGGNVPELREEIAAHEATDASEKVSPRSGPRDEAPEIFLPSNIEDLISERSNESLEDVGQIGGNADDLLEAIEASGREDEAPEGASGGNVSELREEIAARGNSNGRVRDEAPEVLPPSSSLNPSEAASGGGTGEAESGRYSGLSAKLQSIIAQGFVPGRVSAPASTNSIAAPISPFTTSSGSSNSSRSLPPEASPLAPADFASRRAR